MVRKNPVCGVWWWKIVNSEYTVWSATRLNFRTFTLFNYVNDICNSCNSNILSFADDTTVYVSDSDIHKAYLNANEEINNVYTWFCANKLSLNANKTKYIFIWHNQRPLKLCDEQLCINNIPLTRIGNDCLETSTKFLGIHIDPKTTHFTDQLQSSKFYFCH